MCEELKDHSLFARNAWKVTYFPYTVTAFKTVAPHGTADAAGLQLDQLAAVWPGRRGH
jgi:hypothetical protein